MEKAGHTARNKDQTLHRVATTVREEIKRMTMQKMATRHNKEGGNHLEQESNSQKAMENTDGGLHPAVDGQSLGEGVKCPLKLRQCVNQCIHRSQAAAMGRRDWRK